MALGGGVTPLMSDSVRDGMGRRIDYVRISLTDRCNYRCVFCMPPEGKPYIPHDCILRYAELLRLSGIFASLGICHFKVTGGEPLCRLDASAFVADLAGIPGVRDVTLTTNGSLVEPHLESLAQAGVAGVTFSLPSLDSAVFQRITRSSANPEAILRAMDRAAALGMTVKTNTVPLIGFNEDVVPIARHALMRGFTARFIELMPIGSGKVFTAVPQRAIRTALEREFGPLIPVEQKMGNGPAKVYNVAGYPGNLGFIAAMTDRFCAACNRVRLTSQGFLKTCLCHTNGVDLRTPLRTGADDGELTVLVREAIRAKPSGHTFSFAPSATTAEEGASMNSIGG